MPLFAKKENRVFHLYGVIRIANLFLLLLSINVFGLID